MVTPPLFDITAPEGGQKGFTRGMYCFTVFLKM